MKLKALQAGLIYVIANAMSAGVPFLLLPVLTRALSPDDYGKVVGFFLLVTFSTSIAGLNVHSAVSVKWFERNAGDFPRLVGTALYVATASTLVCGLLLFACAPFLRSTVDLEPKYWFLAAVQTGAMVVVGIRTALWQSQRFAFRAAALQVFTALLNVTFSLLGVFALSLGGTGRIIGSVTASVSAALCAVWLLRSQRDLSWSAAGSQLRGLLRFGVPLIPYTLAGSMLATADRFSVSAVLGREALGIYGTAAQLGMIMNVLADAFIKASSPWMYTQLAARNSRANLRVVGIFYLSVPIWLGVAVAVWLILWLAGPLILDRRYASAINLSIYFLVAGGVTAVATNICGLFFFTSRNEWLTVATGGAALAASALAPGLAIALGLRGAALAFLSTQGLLLTFCWLLSLRIQPMPWTRPALAVRVLVRALVDR